MCQSNMNPFTIYALPVTSAKKGVLLIFVSSSVCLQGNSESYGQIW